MKNVTFKKQALAVSIGLAFGAAGSVAFADAVLFPVVQSGNGMATYMQLSNTATIGNGAGVVLNSSTSSAYQENLRFVYNYATSLTTASNGTISMVCTHIDLPGGTSDKDTMLFEATTGSGSTATQLLPVSGSGYAADKSFAPRLTGPIYGSIMVSNAWTSYQPMGTTGNSQVGTGTWAGTTPNGANEGTIFGQAWVVDTVHGTMYGYNALNDPDEATASSAYNGSATTAFNANTPDQYLLAWAPTYNNTVVTRYWAFPFAASSAYGSVTPAGSVTLNIGGRQTAEGNLSYNLVDLGQSGFWDHNEGLISGLSSITVTCGGVNMPLSALMSAAQWNIVQYTGGLAYADVPMSVKTEATNTSFTGSRDAALMYKQISVANGAVVSLVSEPGVRTFAYGIDPYTNTLSGNSAGNAGTKPAIQMQATRSYTR